MVALSYYPTKKKTMGSNSFWSGKKQQGFYTGDYVGQSGEEYIHSYFPVELTDEQMEEIHSMLSSGSMTAEYLDNLYGKGNYDWVKSKPVNIYSAKLSDEFESKSGSFLFVPGKPVQKTAQSTGDWKTVGIAQSSDRFSIFLNGVRYPNIPEPFAGWVWKIKFWYWKNKGR